MRSARWFGRLLALGGAVCTLTACWPGPAWASSTQESTFQDDNRLIFNTPTGTVDTLDTLRALGVDRIRVSLFWNAVAPQPLSKTRPSFDAADPAAYPAGSWDRYDKLLTLAHARGIAVNFNVTDPAPYWATGSPPRADIEKTYAPSAVEFGRFVRAAGTRYSGSYVPPGSSQPLARVDYWSIWNEPNQAGWLTPQWVPAPGRPGRWVEAAPARYRALFDAAWAALSASGHGGDTVLIGETAPKGLSVRGPTRSIKALHFLRLVYCLDDRYRPLRGRAATLRSCPADASGSRRFASEHPGLFAATGYSHHPYELIFGPTVVPHDPDFVTIANLPRLSSALARIMTVYGRRRPGGVPLYLTEFGYLTNPPNPTGVSLAQQAAFLDRSEFIAYNNPNVTTLAQFLLRDDLPRPGRNRLEGYGGTFQTGLEFRDGRPKPSFASYRIPIFIPIAHARRGHALRVWGHVRPAPRSAPSTAEVQLRRGGRGGFQRVASVAVDPARGFVNARVRIPASGDVRLSYRDPGGSATFTSRAVRVRVR